jgi:glycosyltransferase involved in cell wall biosynthesis
VKLSVVIPCYNAASTISSTLDALLRQESDHEWEIVIADNGSTDNTRDVVSKYQADHTKIRLIDAARKRGPSYARNAGVQSACGEFVAFCDADDEVDANWVREISRAIEKHDFVASRMGVHRSSDPQVAELKKHRQARGLIQYRYVPYLPHAGASGLGIRKQIHERIGGFDEDFVYCEDADYCWKAQLAGHPLHFEQRALVYVRHRETSSGQFKQGLYWGEYSVLLVKKYVPRGMPKPRINNGLKQWSNLIRTLPKVGQKIQRQKFVWGLGYRVGHLIGSIRFRILVL